MQYTTPTMVEFGHSNDLIQGTCGWGTENLSLDKTGYYSYSTYKCNSSLKDCYSTSVCANSNPGDGCKGLDSNC
ncbi:hypothetical protein DFQ01_12338 [Paenibacillus cellulosilyticus]|uniref:Uncharacterized protein n=1 Tax=Paenibacillus cellulosilyticus TaxID=375489 RepID=A0A2V2YPD3_9BACL|nr:hypothetical protein DFQ01_12338 [Paenibacillus cellulosilyticus]